MFGFIKDQLKKIYSSVTTKAHALFARTHVDEETLKELEIILIEADTGSATTKAIIESLRTQCRQGTITEGDDLRAALQKELLATLAQAKPALRGDIYMLVGINGSGKTTCASKLSHLLRTQGKKVLFVAADTFRAAAPEQLGTWAERTGADIVLGKENQDPASVVFAGCEKFKQGGYDALIIDTAGRLQTKTNLMRELEKIKNVAQKQLPNLHINTLLTVDAMLGQNSFEQAKLFHESTDLSGIILTKMDGTGRGGIVFAIVKQFGIPVTHVSFGEQMEQLKLFNAQEYVEELL